MKVVSKEIDCDGTFDLWNISEGCKKYWLFLWREAGVLCQYLRSFSFLLELIGHSDLAFQKQRKGTLVFGV